MDEIEVRGRMQTGDGELDEITKMDEMDAKEWMRAEENSQMMMG